MSEALERHISIYPHGFDNTDIGARLRKTDISIDLYADIRDKLFRELKKERAFNGRFLRELETLQDEMENLVERVSDYRGEMNIWTI